MTTISGRLLKQALVKINPDGCFEYSGTTAVKRRDGRYYCGPQASHANRHDSKRPRLAELLRSGNPFVSQPRAA